MDEFNQLREMMETNFRLSSLRTREQGAQIKAELNKVKGQVARMAEQTRELVVQLGVLGDTIAVGFEEQAQRDDSIVEVLSGIGQGRLDLRKQLADLERRVSALEKKAS